MPDQQPSEAARNPATDALLASPIEAASPEALRAAHTVLNRAFDGGKRDLDGYAHLMKLLIAHALHRAAHAPEDDAQAYKLAAIPMSFNLAANTWVGWGPSEVGAVAPVHERLGLAAARKNIELAAEVGLGPERRRNGYWILGAHLLAAGDCADAATAFATSRDLAGQAGDEAAKGMAQGWMHVARTLAGHDETAQLEGVKAALRQRGGDGAFYADQYDTALTALRDRPRAAR